MDESTVHEDVGGKDDPTKEDAIIVVSVVALPSSSLVGIDVQSSRYQKRMRVPTLSTVVVGGTTATIVIISSSTILPKSINARPPF